MEQQVLAWITHYGYVAHLCLVLGNVGLPVSDETMLTFSGYLVFNGTSLCRSPSPPRSRQRQRDHTELRAGPDFRYSRDPSVWQVSADPSGPSRKAHSWFHRVGHWSAHRRVLHSRRPPLHGLRRRYQDCSPRSFAIYAYSGALIWVSTFIGLGYASVSDGGRTGEHPPLLALRRQPRSASALSGTSYGGSDSDETAVIASAVATTTTAPITLYQSHAMSVNHHVARIAASPTSIPMKHAVPPDPPEPNASTKHPSSVP